MNETRLRLFHKWPWERGPVRFAVAAYALIPVAVTVVLYSLIGPKALPTLAFAFFSPLFWLVYGSVGRRVRALHRGLASDEGGPVDSLIVHGMIQSPGIALLKRDELILIRVVGERVSVPLVDIESVREVTRFNGAKLLGKTGFWLDTSGPRRLGFAVSNVFVERFRQGLSPEHRSALKQAARSKRLW